MFEPFERAALPLAEAKKKVQSIKSSARKFFSDLFSGPSDDATTFADELVDLAFQGDFASGCCRSRRRAIPRSPKWKARRPTARVLVGTDRSAT
jgi:hypothetical protein